MALSKEERSKICKNSGQRGNNFQRKIAKIFTAWFKEHDLDIDFHSTPRSGGLRWQKRPDVIGDIVTPDNFLFTIECKKPEKIDFHAMLLRRGANTVEDLINFWEQSCDEAHRAGRMPMLVVEKKRGKPVVFVPWSFYARVFPSYYSDCNIKASFLISPQYHDRWSNVCMMFVSDFIKGCKPTDLLRKRRKV